MSNGFSTIIFSGTSANPASAMSRPRRTPGAAAPPNCRTCRPSKRLARRRSSRPWFAAGAASAQRSFSSEQSAALPAGLRIPVRRASRARRQLPRTRTVLRSSVPTSPTTGGSLSRGGVSVSPDLYAASKALAAQRRLGVIQAFLLLLFTVELRGGLRLELGIHFAAPHRALPFGDCGNLRFLPGHGLRAVLLASLQQRSGSDPVAGGPSAPSTGGARASSSDMPGQNRFIVPTEYRVCEGTVNRARPPGAMLRRASWRPGATESDYALFSLAMGRLVPPSQ